LRQFDMDFLDQPGVAGQAKDKVDPVFLAVPGLGRQ